MLQMLKKWAARMLSSVHNEVQFMKQKSLFILYYSKQNKPMIYLRQQHKIICKLNNIFYKFNRTWCTKYAYHRQVSHLGKFGRRHWSGRIQGCHLHSWGDWRQRENRVSSVRGCQNTTEHAGQAWPGSLLCYIRILKPTIVSGFRKSLILYVNLASDLCHFLLITQSAPKVTRI